MDFLIDDDLTVDEVVEISTALQESFELDWDDKINLDGKEMIYYDNII